MSRSVVLDANKSLNQGGTFHGVIALISPGELVDKITILEIKSEKIVDAEKKTHIDYELSTLTTVYNETFITPDIRINIDKIKSQLYEINSMLWNLEDLIRELQKTGDFSQKYISTSVSITRNNDIRASLKQTIDRLLGSKVSEQKSHATVSSLSPSFFSANKVRSLEQTDPFCGFSKGFLLGRRF